MLGFSGAEVVVVAAVALLVIGPKDIPVVMYHLGRMARRLHYIRFAFTRQFDDFLREHDLADFHEDVNFETLRRNDEKDKKTGTDHE